MNEFHLCILVFKEKERKIYQHNNTMGNKFIYCFHQKNDSLNTPTFI